jgi:hypothetical protein
MHKAISRIQFDLHLWHGTIFVVCIVFSTLQNRMDASLIRTLSFRWWCWHFLNLLKEHTIYIFRAAALKMEVVCFAETLACTYMSTWGQNSEEQLQTFRLCSLLCEDLLQCQNTFIVIWPGRSSRTLLVHIFTCSISVKTYHATLLSLNVLLISSKFISLASLHLIYIFHMWLIQIIIRFQWSANFRFLHLGFFYILYSFLCDPSHSSI